MSHSQEPDASTLEQCLRLLGANDDQSARGGQRDPLNPDMDWRWHFQMNVRELPCSVQSDHGVESPWQLLHDLQPPAQQTGNSITLLPLEAEASFVSSGRKYSWPDDEPVDVRQFTASFAICFAPNASAFCLGYFPEEEGEEVVCVLMNSLVESQIRSMLGDEFAQNFVVVNLDNDGRRFQSRETLTEA